ncbi:hypothetical protein K438DRAFT_1767678 [Mycena galopus ATCC 62051]|nr:hypothetical protein K438DRAFT_1767678 [Mycena galopus ATCC 62051]
MFSPKFSALLALTLAALAIAAPIHTDRRTSGKKVDDAVERRGYYHPVVYADAAAVKVDGRGYPHPVVYADAPAVKVDGRGYYHPVVYADDPASIPKAQEMAVHANEIREDGGRDPHPFNCAREITWTNDRDDPVEDK